MNIFINLLLLLVFIYAIVYLKFPDIESNNYIQHKFILFVLTFFFQFVYTIISKIKDRCRIEIKDVVRSSLQVAIATIIGYSIFTDIKHMDSGVKAILATTNDNMLYLYVSIIITLFVALIRTMDIMFSSKYGDCVKY